MISDALIDIPSLIMIGSAIRKLLGEIHKQTHTQQDLISLILLFQNKESRLRPIPEWNLSPRSQFSNGRIQYVQLNDPSVRGLHLYVHACLTIQWLPGPHFPMIKRPVREADHSSYLMMRLRMRGIIFSIHPYVLIL
jgi:hypothetical protein